MRYILVFCGILFSLTAPAQESKHEKEKVKIEAVITELFNAYRAGDSSRVAATFTHDALGQTIYITDVGEQKITDPVSIQEFVEYIGKGFEEVHDEQLWDIAIHTDGIMATVWAQYAFYLDDVFSHCGTETFLLRKVKNKWKIFYLVDTRQKKGCKIPEAIQK